MFEIDLVDYKKKRKDLFSSKYKEFLNLHTHALPCSSKKNFTWKIELTFRSLVRSSCASDMFQVTYARCSGAFFRALESLMAQNHSWTPRGYPENTVESASASISHPLLVTVNPHD